MPKAKPARRNEAAREFLAESAPKPPLNGAKPASPPKPAASVLTQPPPAPEQRQPLNVLPASTVSLVHDDGRQYDFHRLPAREGEEWVAVVLSGRWGLGRIEMPQTEGAYLWRRLKGQGFEQF